MELALLAQDGQDCLPAEQEVMRCKQDLALDADGIWRVRHFAARVFAVAPRMARACGGAETGQR